jgi:hypothetical protein
MAGFDLDELPEQLRNVLAAYTDPTSLTSRTLGAVRMDHNDPDVLAAEIPATNGVCTARAPAGFYAALIGSLLEPDTRVRGMSQDSPSPAATRRPTAP